MSEPVMGKTPQEMHAEGAGMFLVNAGNGRAAYPYTADDEKENWVVCFQFANGRNVGEGERKSATSWGDAQKVGMEFVNNSREDSYVHLCLAGGCGVSFGPNLHWETCPYCHGAEG